MRVLGIETSCDETAVAVVRDDGEGFVVEKNVLASQAALHAQWGGVVPEVAAREHAALLFPLLREVVGDLSTVDAIAVTVGPGLVPALRVGVETAKALAWASGKPLVAVNHLEGHIYSVWLSQTENGQMTNNKLQTIANRQFSISEVPPEISSQISSQNFPQFPALCLLVSGGHTELILMRDHGVYELLGMTRDDAAGEAFDKVAKLLGLPYPGGPSISKAATEGHPAAIAFPRPMIDSGDLDFSFAGLKTAVRMYLNEVSPLAKGGLRGVGVADVAASFQQAVVDVLVAKTLEAVKRTAPRSVILAGGVAANRLLRESLRTQAEACGYPLFVPDLSLTGDNAAMIAVAGLMRAKRGAFADPLTLVADPNARVWDQ